MSEEDKDSLKAIVFVVLVSSGIGSALGDAAGHATGREFARDRIEISACESACTRRGSEMLSHEDNLCVCADLRATQADYGRMFVECEP